MTRLIPILLITASVLGASVAGADSGRHLAQPRADALASGALDNGKVEPAQRPKVLLKLGSLRTDPKCERLTDALASASRQALGDLPGVRLLEESEDATAAAKKRRPPVILITGKLAEIGQKADGEELLVSAKVEYFVHRMPGESIAAVVSGVASARVASSQMRKKGIRERLERSLVAAAVDSAVKRTVPALKAAAD